MWRKHAVLIVILLIFPMTVHGGDHGITLERWEQYTAREQLNFVIGCVEGYTRLARSQGKEVFYRYRGETANVSDPLWELYFLPREIIQILADQIAERHKMSSSVGEVVFDILEVALPLKNRRKRSN